MQTLSMTISPRASKPKYGATHAATYAILLSICSWTCGVNLDAPLPRPVAAPAADGNGEAAQTPTAADPNGPNDDVPGPASEQNATLGPISSPNAVVEPASSNDVPMAKDAYLVLKCRGCGNGAASLDPNLGEGSPLVPSLTDAVSPLPLSYHQGHLVTARGLCLATSPTVGGLVTLQKCSHVNVLVWEFSPALGLGYTAVAGNAVNGVMVAGCASYNEKDPNCYLRGAASASVKVLITQNGTAASPFRVRRANAPEQCLTDNGAASLVAAKCSSQEKGQLWTLYDSGILASGRKNYLRVDLRKTPAAPLLVASTSGAPATGISDLWWLKEGNLFSRYGSNTKDVMAHILDVDAASGAPNATVFQAYGASRPLRPAPWFIGPYLPQP